VSLSMAGQDERNRPTAPSKNRLNYPSAFYGRPSWNLVVEMGVFDRVSGLSQREDGYPTFVCLACESGFDVQHHSCPVCGSYDLRRARWVTD
jgi:hypothetical protein